MFKSICMRFKNINEELNMSQLLLLLWGPSMAEDCDLLFNVESGFYCGWGGQCVRSIVCHKVGIDEQYPELGKHWSMLISATASENCSSIAYIVEVWHSKGTGRSPGSSAGYESLQPAKWNVALLKEWLHVIFEAFLLSINTPMA